jgi:polyhydroxybutyrate depolymerase
VVRCAVFRALLVASIALLTFTEACGGASSDNTSKQTQTFVATSPTPVAAGCPTAPAHAAGDFAQSITSGSSSRTYILHIPTGYDGTRPTPVVLELHGYALSGKQMATYTKFNALAEQQGFIVVTPDGAGTPAHWNWRKAVDEPDDVQFVRDLFAKLDGDLCVDSGMTFVAGFSDGAAMSRILACEMPERIAAIATVASPGVNCIAPVPMVAFHGTTDPLMPFEGGVVPPEVGGGGTFLPVRRVVSEWARGLGCDGLALISRPAASTELSTYTQCSHGDGEALLYTLLGGGHTWPGSTPLPTEAFGATNVDIDASSIIWDFFAAHRLVE